jgi:uncharacterized protein YdcH (DUF465 family)
MSHVPHDLSQEFPQAGSAIARLKARDPHFARLAARYHVVNRNIHRAETNIEPCGDMHDLELRRERLTLKDEIAAILARDAA